MNASSFHFLTWVFGSMVLLMSLFSKAPTYKLQPVRIKANRNHHLARDSR